MLPNLIIGYSSQLSIYLQKYFDANDIPYIVLSSRTIGDECLNKNWNKVFMCFGESRKYINTIEEYELVNYKLTLQYIEQFKNISKTIYVYSTCELWNNKNGPISINDNFCHVDTHYLNSKRKLVDTLYNSDHKYKNVIVLFPFNFNSPYRTKNFLFGKVFYSIINNKPISVGNTNFYRELIHPNFVISETLNADCNKIIGSGRLTYVSDFISDLYDSFSLNPRNLITYELDSFKEYVHPNEYYLRSNECLYSYKELLAETIADIRKHKENS